jgi:hypothetical protein
MCSLAREAQRFATTCSERIRGIDALRAQTHCRRALSITYVVGRGSLNASGLGIGHLLTAAYRLHSLCIALRRYCFVKVYGSELHRFLSYPDGRTWAPTESALRCYSPLRERRIRWFSYWWDRHSNLSRLEDVLSSKAPCEPKRCWNLTRPGTFVGPMSDASLIRLTIVGWVPLEIARVDPGSALEQARQRPSTPTPASAHMLRRVDRCTFRYVTTPLPSLLTAEPGGAPADMEAAAPASAVHFRTGFADVEDEELVARLHAANRSRSRRVARRVATGFTAGAWLEAACPRPAWLTTADPDGRRHSVFSDAPGLLREIRRRSNTSSDVLGATPDPAPVDHQGSPRPMPQTTTRTWGAASRDAIRAALADLVSAGLSSTLYVAPQLHHCRHEEGHARESFLRRESCGTRFFAEDPANWHWSTFYRPLISRSLCTERVVLSVPGCEAFPGVFTRDQPVHLRHLLLSRDVEDISRRFRQFQHTVLPSHPCKHSASEQSAALVRTAPGRRRSQPPVVRQREQAAACYRGLLAALS